MIVFTTLFLLYLVFFHPFKLKLDRSLQMFSHSVLIFIYFLVLCVAFLSDYQSQESLGFALIGAVGVLFLGNVIPIVVTKILECRKKCKKKRRPAPERYVPSEQAMAQSVPTTSPLEFV